MAPMAGAGGAQPWLQAVLQPLDLAGATSAPSPLLYCWHELIQRLDEAPQQKVAVGALLLGAFFIVCGSRLIKPLFVTSCASFCALSVFAGCQATQYPLVMQWAPIVAAAVALPSMKLWCLAYPSFLFLSGASLGGCGVFLAFTMGLAKAQPSSLLAGSILSALVIGLSFIRCHDMWWRFLTPITGGLAVAASLRFFIVTLIMGIAKWTEFVADLQKGTSASPTLGGAAFWTSWAVLTVLGWYLQVGPRIGLWKPQPLLPPRAQERLSAVLRYVGLEEAPGKGSFLPSSNTEPLLKRLHLSEMSTDTTSSVGVPHVLSKTKEAGSALLNQDYRPEVSLLTAVITVVCLNSFLANQPTLFMGHAVLMSLAFLPLLSAGMVSYATTSLLLPRLFGAPVGATATRRHLSHGAFNGFALACALGGYACIYQNHKENGISQFGLENLKKDPARLMHVWIGYLVLALMLVQAFSGVAKLYFTAFLGEKRLMFHNVMGRAIYCLAAVNQLIAYTFPGLIPMWATPLLAALLIITVGSTLFFLQEKHRTEKMMRQIDEEKQRWLEERRQTVEKLHSISSLNSDGSTRCASARGSRPINADGTAALLLVAERTLDRVHARGLLGSTFTEWHRCIQKQRLEEAAEALEGQDRLVQFLSGEMVQVGPSGVGA